ncbi:MAG: BMP family ABC transporter substrate-binding protein [Acetobacteraceae bacterium]
MRELLQQREETMNQRNDQSAEHRGIASHLSRRGLIRAAAGIAALAGVEVLPEGAAAAGKLIALVHTQAAGDNGPIDSMIAHLRALAKAKHLTARAIYASDPATYESIFKSLGAAGAAVVVATFPEVAQPLEAVAPHFSHTKWIQIFGDPMHPVIENIVTVSYDYYLGCYLSGLFGARMSKTGKIGYIGGASMPPLNADLNALKAAAISVNPAIKFSGAFAGSFQDPAKGHNIASQMYESGVDYIQTDSAATDAGIIQAATEGPGRMVSAISKQQYRLGPKAVIAIVKLDFGLSLATEVNRALAPGWTGGHVTTGLKGGIIDFELSDVYLKEGPAALVTKARQVWPKIAEARSDIIAGKLKVPFETKL